MEFQSAGKAWYDVNLSWDGETLTASYVNGIFHAGKFKNLEEVESFKNRFRKRRVQLQDRDCKKLDLGKTICASYEFDNGEVKFYDAMVVEVLNEVHKVGKEEQEECSCTYLLKWHEGPLMGKQTFAKIRDICIIPPPGKRVDPQLASFLKIARQRIEKRGFLEGESSGHKGEEPNTSTRGKNSFVTPEAFFNKLRRQRRNRYAYRTAEGKLNGGCWKSSTRHG